MQSKVTQYCGTKVKAYNQHLQGIDYHGELSKQAQTGCKTDTFKSSCGRHWYLQRHVIKSEDKILDSNIPMSCEWREKGDTFI